MKQYKVALTFAGEQRAYVQQVAERLAVQLGREQVFYDNNEKAKLAIPNLDLYLTHVYRYAGLIVPFLSKEYGEKAWCQHEWRTVRTVVFEGRAANVMYCRFDEAEIDGLPPIDGYIDLREHSPEEIADFILERLGEATAQESAAINALRAPTAKAAAPGDQVFIDQRTYNLTIQPSSAEDGYAATAKNPQNLFAIFGSEIGQYASILSQELHQKLERIHELYRRGKVQDAYKACHAIRANTEFWQRLDAADQAKVLLQEARYGFDIDEPPTEIRKQMMQAKALDAGIDDTLVRVLLQAQEHGVTSALAELGEPKNVNGFNLRLSLLFRANQYDDALAALQNPPTDVVPDAESRRFHALALLAKGDLPGARAKIEPVLAEQANWELVQLAAAMIDYWSGMADGLTTPRVVAAPPPAPAALAKSDPESLAYFRKAEQRFVALLESTQRNDEQKCCLEAWRLASLANDPVKRQEAEAYCCELLARDHAHYRVLFWAITRLYPFDESLAEASLEKRVDEAVADNDELAVELTPVLCALYLKNGKLAEAQSLLDKTKPLFTENEAQDVWAFWQVQRLLAGDEIEAAKRIAAEVEDQWMRERLEAIVLRAQAIKTQDFKALACQLEALFQATGDPHYLLEFCEISFELREWETIVPHAQRLLEVARNSYSVELAAAACWNSGRHISALAILENHQADFDAERLPDHLWRLKIMCLLRSGKTSEAIADVKAISLATATTDNLRTCVDACVQMGDLLTLRAIAREMLSREDASFETFAKMASLLSSCDSDLAKQYLLRARDGLLQHPQYAALLFDTSSRLNLEREIGPLFRQIVNSYPKEVTNVWAIPAKEFPEQQQGMRERWQWTMEQYGKGALPLHLIASDGNLTLVEWLHAIPEWNRSHFAPRQRTVIYTRHGQHLVKTGLVANANNWRIHADITSLILAESLGILDKVEETFGPIIISPNVQPALIWQLNRLLPQASRVKNCQSILRLRDEEAFQLVSPAAEAGAGHPDSEADVGLLALLQRARKENGYVVTYLPVVTLTGEPVSIPTELEDRLINCRAVLDSLQEQGWLTAEQYEDALFGLGTEGGKEAVSVVLTEKTKLFLEGNIAETLAGAELLGEICECFEVWVDERQLEWAKQQIALNGNSERLQTWTRRLIERIREGLEKDKYRTLCLPDVLLDEMRKDLERDSLEIRCFSDLLKFEAQPDDVIWTDDRALNRHPMGGSNAPIIAISEVLCALKEQRKLNERKYYEGLLALRAGNLRYLPLNQFEILHHLKGVRLKDKEEAEARDEIVETASLKKLRRSIAACLLDIGKLQPEPENEGWFLHSINHSVQSAIILLWKDASISIEHARACSNWIFDSLFVSPIGFVHLCKATALSASFAEGMGDVLGDYLSSGIFLNADVHAESPRQRAYYEWVNERLLSVCFNADRQTLAATARRFRSELQQAVSEGRTPEFLEVGPFLMLQHLHLPSELAEDLAAELVPQAAALHSFGLPSFEIIGFHPLKFPTEKLLAAFERAWQTGKATLIAIGEKEPCVIEGVNALEHTKPSFLLKSHEKRLQISVEDEIWKLRVEDVSDREAILRRNRMWFDCDQQSFEQEVKRLAALEGFHQRFEAVSEIRQQSAAVYYQMLPEDLNGDASPGWVEMMPPSAAALLRHFRLPASCSKNSSFSERLTHSAETLLKEEGLAETLDHFACLPVRLPDLLIGEVARSPREEQRRLLQGFSRRWTSPLSTIHLIDLAARAGNGEEDFLAIIRLALDWLFVDKHCEGRFAVFRQTLRLVSTGLERLGDAKQLDAATRLLLTWAHATRLLNIYGQIGKGITFSWVDEWSRWETVFSESDYANDALHPQRLSRPVFLLRSLTAVFAEQRENLVTALNVSELLNDALFKKTGEQKLPAVQLLFDPTLVLNQTGSFLGETEENSVRALLNEEAASFLSPVELRKWIAEAIEQIVADPSLYEEWAKIHLVTGDLPLPPELAEPFRTMAEKLDLFELYQREPEVAAMAIGVIAAQLTAQSDETLRQRFERDVLQIALHENKPEAEEDEEGNVTRRKIGTVVLEVAMRMVFRNAADPGESGSTEGLLLRLIEYAGQFRDLIPIPGLLRIIHEMPPDKAWRLWPMLLAARATT